MRESTALKMTEGQEREIVRLFEEGGRWALGIVKEELSREEVQLIINKGNELREDFPELLRKLGKGKFSDEEVESSYVYPWGYSPKDITAQKNILQELFPDTGCAQEELAKASLPKGAEAFFAIPQWQKLGQTYEEAVEKVFKAIASKRAFCNFRKRELGPDYLRRNDRTERMLQTLAQQQGTDILIVPAQFGLRHQGRSVRRAREMFTAQEFGLGAFEVGIMLLTYPERLTDCKDLWVDCPGDEYSPDADGQFDDAPYFDFFDGEVKFGADWTGRTNDSYGSASAFLPQ